MIAGQEGGSITAETAQLTRAISTPQAQRAAHTVIHRRCRMEGAGTKRLMIQQMVLENFKSYAGAQTVGPFHKVGHFGSCLLSSGMSAQLFVWLLLALQHMPWSYIRHEKA